MEHFTVSQEGLPAEISGDGNPVLHSLAENDFIQGPGGDLTLLPPPIDPPISLFFVGGFSPTSGAPGTQVTISGSGFLGTFVVRFGGRDARSFTVFSENQIVAEVPADAVDGPITVGGPNGTASSFQSFDVLASSPLPSLNGFTPLQGQVGSQVMLTGQNLSPVNAVLLGSASCPVLSASANSLLIQVPAGASTNPFTVMTPAGSAMSQGFFTVIQSSILPRIDSFSPVSGPVGTNVTINGANFTGTFEVAFGGMPSNLFSAGANQINAQVPPGAPSGPIRVTTSVGSAISAASFTVQAQSNLPTLTSFSPLQGAPGTQVSLQGTNLVGATVRFNGTAATVLSNTGTQILTLVPQGAGSGPISVATAAGTAISTGSFVVLQPSDLPRIDSFSPTSGASGTQVTVFGNNFIGLSQVLFRGSFGDLSAPALTVRSNTELVAQVPQGAITGPIKVVTPRGTAVSATNFTVLTQSNLPSITGLNPVSGTAGTSVTISGLNLSPAVSVKFNGVEAGFVFNSPSSIVTNVPAGASSGFVTITTPAGTAQSQGTFVVTQAAPAPLISGFSPTSGKPGDTITIFGANFTSSSVVRFNGVNALFTIVDNVGQIRAVVPQSATSGRISVTTAGGTAQSPGDFMVLGVGLPPSITGFNPASARPGVQIAILGNNLAGTTGVQFSGVNGIWVNAAFAVQSPNQVNAIVPTGAVDGPVRLLSPSGSTLSPQAFNVIDDVPAQPVITSFTPRSGRPGTQVTLLGANLQNTIAVGFAGTSASFTQIGADSVSTTVPQGARTGPITLTTTGGVAISPGSFTVTTIIRTPTPRPEEAEAATEKPGGTKRSRKR